MSRTPPAMYMALNDSEPDPFNTMRQYQEQLRDNSTGSGTYLVTQLWTSCCNNFCYCWEYISVEVHIIMMIYVVNKVGQEMAVSSMPLLMHEVFHWNGEQVGYFMAFVGGLVLPTNVLVNSVAKDAEERDIMLKLSYLSVVGVLCICHISLLGSYTLFQYIVGTTIVFTSLNAIEGVVMSLLSKLISPELAKGTFNSGLLATEAGTLGRVLGDMAITYFGGKTAAAPVSIVDKLYVPLGLILSVSIIVIHRYFDALQE